MRNKRGHGILKKLNTVMRRKTEHVSPFSTVVISSSHLLIIAVAVFFLCCCPAYLSRFLSSLSPFVPFTVDSSVSHYAHLTDAPMQPIRIDEHMYHTVSKLPQPSTHAITQQKKAAAATASNITHLAHQLTGASLNNLIGSVGEWNVQSPLVTSSMEMLLYIPPKQKRPLFFNMNGKKKNISELRAQHPH